MQLDWIMVNKSHFQLNTIALLLCSSLAACTSGGGGSSDESGGAIGSTTLQALSTEAALERQYPLDPINCSLPEMRNWVEANMLDYYLFYDQVPIVNLQDYDDVETLVDDLRVLPFDRFTYISDAAASSALFEEGKLLGYGWKLLRTSASDVRMGFVYPQSPLAEQNVKRGDYLLAINGVHPLDMSSEQWDEFLGTGEEIKSPVFTILNPQGEQRNLTVTRSEFNLDTVLDAQVLANGPSNVAYLAFTQFLETSNQELEQAFSLFREQNANELILDLRYNSGGRISVANNLASKIAGSAYAGQNFAEISFNDKFSEDNIPYALTAASNSLGLDRVVVLSSASTCSASEMIINGLKPFIDVVQLGGTSCGKPYGSAPDQACGKQMNALQFSFVNANGVGDYYEGIAADCAAVDTTDFELGDSQEGMLRAGLDYISSGTCGINANANVETARSAASRTAAGVQTDDPLQEEKVMQWSAGSK